MDVSSSPRQGAATSPGPSASSHPAPTTPARATGAGQASAPTGKPFAALLVGKRAGAAQAKRAPLGEATHGGSAPGQAAAVPTRPVSDRESGGQSAAGGERDLGGGVEDEQKGTKAAAAHEASDVLDPAARQAAFLAPPTALGHLEQATASDTALRGRSLEELLPVLVRRVAWAGDRHKGTVRLELGAGAYAGTTVTVHADGGRVRVELGGTEGPELDRLRARLDARLRGHGLDVESVT